MTPFEQVLKKYRETSFSERDKGFRFEELLKAHEGEHFEFKEAKNKLFLSLCVLCASARKFLL